MTLDLVVDRQPEATLEPAELPMPEKWMGLIFKYEFNAANEFWWPGYARRPCEEWQTWEIPDDLPRNSVRGATVETYASPPVPDWALYIVGVLYFDADGHCLDRGGTFSHPRDVCPGDVICITSIRPDVR